MRLQALDQKAHIYVIEDVLDAQECQQLIEQSEALGYDDTLATSRGGSMRHDAIRNNARVIHDDPEMAALLWQRMSSMLPQTLPFWQIDAMNERLRFYRYQPGQHFVPHFDTSFQRDRTHQSQLTVLVYLNEDFMGGQTRFVRRKPVISMQPRTGAALIFAHRQWHEGGAVTSGCKYVLRTDVMYRWQA